MKVKSGTETNSHPFPAKGERRDGRGWLWPREQEETGQVKIGHRKTKRAKDPTDGLAPIARDDIDRQAQEDGNLNRRYDHETGRASHDQLLCQALGALRRCPSLTLTCCILGESLLSFQPLP